MTSKPLLPQAFWFRIAAACPRIEKIPRAEGAGRLLDLPESCALPDLAAARRRRSPGLRFAWAGIQRGLGIAVLAEGVSSEQLDRGRPEGFAAAPVLGGHA